jgi:excinuclease ABC subunit A
MEVIKMADHLIDIGPEGGRDGGRLLCCGTPEELIRNEESYTAKYLREERGEKTRKGRQTPE